MRETLMRSGIRMQNCSDSAWVAGRVLGGFRGGVRAVSTVGSDEASVTACSTVLSNLRCCTPHYNSQASHQRQARIAGCSADRKQPSSAREVSLGTRGAPERRAVRAWQTEATRRTSPLPPPAPRPWSASSGARGEAPSSCHLWRPVFAMLPQGACCHPALSRSADAQRCAWRQCNNRATRLRRRFDAQEEVENAKAMPPRPCSPRLVKGIPLTHMAPTARQTSHGLKR